MSSIQNKFRLYFKNKKPIYIDLFQNHIAKWAIQV